MTRARTRTTGGTMPTGTARRGRGNAAGRRDAAASAATDDARARVYLAARRALLGLLLDGRERASADDLRDAVDVPAGLPAATVDAALGRMAYDGIIAPAGDVVATRPERAGAVLTVWRLRDRAAAERRLARDQAAAVGAAGGGP